MRQPRNSYLLEPTEIFRESWLPIKASLAGYAALAEIHGLPGPLPAKLSAVAAHNKASVTAGWRIFPARYAPQASLEGQLTFALKYEGVNLLVLRQLFQTVGPKAIEAVVQNAPTGAYSRRLWFLYEWLLDKRLSLPGMTRGSYVPVLGPLQYGVPGIRSQRHRVLNNLPGTPAFCPSVSVTAALEEFIKLDLAKEAAAAVAEVPKDLLARTAAFLLLKDSRSSYAIEGERPPQNRIERWGRVIGEAGKIPFDLDELFRLQRIVIGDDRFVELGLRTEDGFIGEHDRASGAPLPDHIDARPKDLTSLMQGLIDFDRGAGQELDPVIAAALLAFGFVYIHPLQDGNGRLHRYLIHNVLAHRGFNPPGVVFPVSAAILDRIADYKAVLESYSAKLLPLMQWEPTPKGNVSVLNETADFYRYPDLTRHAEFLYEVVAKTIREDLPREAEFLARYDRFRAALQEIVDMPDVRANLLFRFLDQNKGKLSKKGREKELAKLKPTELAAIEDIYGSLFA
jgi:hypothetical protein